MNYKMYEISNKKVKMGKDTYTFIIEEKWFPGKYFRAYPKFYTILKNGEGYLYTTLHQTFYAEKRKILKGVE